MLLGDVDELALEVTNIIERRAVTARRCLCAFFRRLGAALNTLSSDVDALLGCPLALVQVADGVLLQNSRSAPAPDHPDALVCYWLGTHSTG
jgi:hypothetical protein